MLIRAYLIRVLIALDILANVILGGMVGETLSGSAYRGELQGKIFPRLFRPVIDFLARLFGERDHCFNAYLSDKIRK